MAARPTISPAWLRSRRAIPNSSSRSGFPPSTRSRSSPRSGGSRLRGNGACARRSDGPPSTSWVGRGFSTSPNGGKNWNACGGRRSTPIARATTARRAAERGGTGTLFLDGSGKALPVAEARAARPGLFALHGAVKDAYTRILKKHWKESVARILPADMMKLFRLVEGKSDNRDLTALLRLGKDDPLRGHFVSRRGRAGQRRGRLARRHRAKPLPDQRRAVGDQAQRSPSCACDAIRSPSPRGRRRTGPIRTAGSNATFWMTVRSSGRSATGSPPAPTTRNCRFYSVTAPARSRARTTLSAGRFFALP